MLRKLLLFSGMLIVVHCGLGQIPGPGTGQPIHLPSGYLDQVRANTDLMDRQLTKQSENYLRGMEQTEQRIKNKLGKTDSASAQSVFGNIGERYGQWQQKMAAGKNSLPENAAGAYIPAFDSLKNTLHFLQTHADMIANTRGYSPEQLQATLNKVQTLQGKLNMAEGLKDYLQQRKQYLSGQLDKLGLGRQLTGINKKTYYYKQQLNDFKDALKDPVRLQKKTIQTLGQLPAYRQFVQRHSYLASIFGVPGDYQLSDSGMKQLQTRANVQKMIQEKVGVGGPAGEQQVMQQMQQSGNELGELKNKLLLLGSREDPADPGFKPNTQKTKSLWKRLEYGADLQFEQSTGLLPTMADFGLSMGYKLNDKAAIGVGAAFKTGLGNGLSNIRFSGQGAGLRSYIDWQLKKNIYLSGGYERNYLNQFQSISQLRNEVGWQHSGLIGLSRKYRLSDKVSGKLQLLYDFLNHTHVPASAPIVFRTGWSF